MKKNQSDYYASNKEKVSKTLSIYYEKNKNRIIERVSLYRKNNLEKIKAYKLIYNKKNAKKLRDDQIKYIAANSLELKKYHSNYRATHKETIRVHRKNRELKCRKNGGKLSKNIIERLFKLQRGKCACCGLPLGENYHMDHIMPIALGGKNVDSNIQLLKATCNRRKSSKHPVDFMQELGFLI
jgi:5-methylcytosine-specific restriction endonuclease McrA